MVLSATTVNTPYGTAASLYCPEGMGFDKRGNLWVSNALSDNEGSIVEFTPAQLTASGSPVAKISWIPIRPATT